MPPNGSGRSRMNERAEEPSAGERITRLEVLAQSAATKTDFANLKAEMAELRADMAEFKGEVKAEMAKLNGRMDALNQKIEGEIASLRSEMKANTARLEAQMAALRAEMHAGFVTTLRWTIGVMLGVIVPFFSAVLAILKFL